jgi:LPXTG-motif cell wall-anchored protein
MYNGAALSTVGGGGAAALASTGPENLLWLGLAAFALVAAGAAVRRIIPRKEA